MVNDSFFHLEELPQVEPIKGFRVRFVHTANMSVGYWDIEAGALLPLHAHPQEQVTSLISGMLELTIDGETRLLRAGAVAVIAGNVAHSGRAITPCRVIDVFYPARDDYRVERV